MKFIFIGSHSDICEEFMKTLSDDDEIITLSRTDPCDIKLDWDKGFKKFSKSDLSKLKNWDILVSFVGSQDPIGPIGELDPMEIIKGININFSYQFAMIASLINIRNFDSITKIILFAGAGTNNAPKNYSIYISSKIALIKFTELIHSEYKNIFATIVGPGWVKTKIHNSTLNQKRELAPESFDETKRRFKENDFNNMELIIKCLNNIINEKSNAFAGKNISAQYDDWDKPRFIDKLKNNSDIYKLRRKT